MVQEKSRSIILNFQNPPHISHRQKYLVLQPHRVRGGGRSVSFWRLSRLAPPFLLPRHVSLPDIRGDACMCVSCCCLKCKMPTLLAVVRCQTDSWQFNDTVFANILLILRIQPVRLHCRVLAVISLHIYKTICFSHFCICIGFSSLAFILDWT